MNYAQTNATVILAAVVVLVVAFIAFVIWLILLPRAIGRRREVDCLSTISTLSYVGILISPCWFVALLMACLATDGTERRRRESHDEAVIFLAHMIAGSNTPPRTMQAGR